MEVNTVTGEFYLTVGIEHNHWRAWFAEGSEHIHWIMLFDRRK